VLRCSRPQSIVLVWGLGADHSDFLMMFLVILGMYLLIQHACVAFARDPRRPSPRPQLRLRYAWRRVLSWIDGAPDRLVPGTGLWWELSGGIFLVGRSRSGVRSDFDPDRAGG